MLTIGRDEKNLLNFVRKYGPRNDFHEPDEEGISAVVVGTNLDNAFGSDTEASPAESQEYVVVLYHEGSNGRDDKVKFNLATLLAWAVQGIRGADLAER